MATIDEIRDPEINSFLAVKASLSKNSIKSYALLLAQFEQYCLQRDWVPAFCDAAKIAAFMDQYRDHKSSTRRSYLGVLKAFYAWAIDEGMIQKDPTKHIHIEGFARANDRIAVSREDFLEMRKKCDNLRELAILYTLYYTGMRATELINITVNDINLSEKYIFVPFSKTTTGNRRIPVHDDYLPVLSKYLEARNKRVLEKSQTSDTFMHHDYAFVNKQFRKLKYRTLLQIVKNLVESTDLDPKTACHAFRRGFVTNIYRQTHNIVLAQQLAGHSNIETTRGYIIGLQNPDEFQGVKF